MAEKGERVYLTTLLAAGILAFLGLSLVPAWAMEPFRAAPGCELENLRVLAPSAEDAMDACVGAARAQSFFAGHGLRLRTPVVLEIDSRLPGMAPPTAAGIFLSDDRRIHLLTFREFRKFGTWFKLPIDREIYRSLAAHEVAHAIVGDGFWVDRPSIQAKEYLAYVALFAVMSPSLRERVLHAIPGSGFMDESRISLIVYMFDPMFFGVQSYRHYMNQCDRTAFLDDVLEGKVLVD